MYPYVPLLPPDVPSHIVNTADESSGKNSRSNHPYAVVGGGGGWRGCPPVGFQVKGVGVACFWESFVVKYRKEVGATGKEMR
jgi:hypothetical protein